MTATAGPIEPNAASSSTTTLEESRPQAGPLPLKRGEIGYAEGEESLGEGAESSSAGIRTPEPALPARHPADRDNAALVPVPLTPTHTPASTTPSPTPSPTPSVSHNVLGKLLNKPKKVRYGGITLTTLIAFTVQLLAILGSIAGWIVATIMLDKSKKNTNAMQPTVSANIFVHVIFAICILGQLLFLERRVYRIRGERYAHLHPGQILPRSMRYRGDDPIVAFSPWNRPPLLTYAAALAQSGVGTGDVEDHIIAQPPPPAYGNTRGSTLLLSGFLRNSLLAQRPPSIHSVNSTVSRPERPLSYKSVDSEWEVVQDVRRAQRLEETLSRLEAGTRRNHS